jgi:predicted lipid carrier protein YhbT
VFPLSIFIMLRGRRQHIDTLLFLRRFKHTI